MKVRRKHVWEDALHHFKSGLPTTKHLRITFLGEPAVDAGGPLREFLQLLMSEIARNNTLFCGDETARVPNHNMVELSKKTYEYVGSMLAVSIVHGGPAPYFFCLWCSRLHHLWNRTRQCQSGGCSRCHGKGITAEGM